MIVAMLELVQKPQPLALEADRPERRNRLSAVPADFYAPNKSAYPTYMRMDKQLSTPDRATELCELYQELCEHRTPSRLYTAGWAAAEAAMIGTDLPQDLRQALIDCAEAAWEDSAQLADEQNKELDPELLVMQHRAHLARANLPLMQGIVNGKVTKADREKAYNDTLNVAILNATSYMEMNELKNYGGIKLCRSLAHEINGVLAVNRTHSATLIALPALARSDCGLYQEEYTHDIQLLELKHGKVRRAFPVEVKSKSKESDFERYETILLEGIGHLQTAPNKSPLATIGLLIKEQQLTASYAEKQELDKITNNVIHLWRHYKREDGTKHCRNIEHCTLYPSERTGFRPQQMGKMALSA